MKTSLFSNIGAIALTGLALTLGTNVSAHDGGHGSSHGSHGSSHGSHGSHGSRVGRGHGSHGRSCSHLPRGCRRSNYRGESCWYGGGHYYRCNPYGGYVIIDAEPEVETTYVETPVVQRRVVETEVVEEPAYEETEDVVSYLPTGCETVYIGGESYWYSNGCYYSRCGHGYKKCHGRPNGHGHGHGHGKQCKTHGSHGSHGSHNTGSHGSHSSHGSHGSHGSSHGSSHGGHGRH